jgi:phosphoribosylaminoimidazolecarboxamide formyltransferase/IMP cyclohydrolase
VNANAMNSQHVRRALISVSDKTGLTVFTQTLTDAGWMIISTGGTEKVLKQHKIPVMAIESMTGVPECMDGRVKTINPKIAGGILARRDNPQHMHELENVLRGGTIDMVVVNLYPFEKTAANPKATFDELIEQIDIGGPSLVRAAAKNFQDVVVVVSPSDYAAVLDQLDQPGGTTRDFRFELARKAFRHTGQYDTAIANTLRDFVSLGETFVREPIT